MSLFYFTLLHVSDWFSRCLTINCIKLFSEMAITNIYIVQWLVHRNNHIPIVIEERACLLNYKQQHWEKSISKTLFTTFSITINNESWVIAHSRGKYHVLLINETLFRVCFITLDIRDMRKGERVWYLYYLFYVLCNIKKQFTFFSDISLILTLNINSLNLLTITLLLYIS